MRLIKNLFLRFSIYTNGATRRSFRHRSRLDLVCREVSCPNGEQREHAAQITERKLSLWLKTQGRMETFGPWSRQEHDAHTGRTAVRPYRYIPNNDSYKLTPIRPKKYEPSIPCCTGAYLKTPKKLLSKTCSSGKTSKMLLPPTVTLTCGVS